MSYRCSWIAAINDLIRHHAASRTIESPVKRLDPNRIGLQKLVGDRAGAKGSSLAGPRGR